MIVTKKLSGRIRWFVSISRKFRGFKFELMFDNPFAIRNQVVVFEMVLLYVTAWLVVYEKEKLEAN